MKIDLFIMENSSDNPERKSIELTTKYWWESIFKGSVFEFGVNHLPPCLFDSGKIAQQMRQHAFMHSKSDFFILTDNDMLPYNAKQLDHGIKMLIQSPDFAILSAWPDPHDFACIELEGRWPINNEEILETYSCGGMRFCRKIPGLVAPVDPRKGYDGVFCRHLWSEHKMRVGYLKKSRAFHLGANCSTLWVD